MGASHRQQGVWLRAPRALTRARAARARRPPQGWMRMVQTLMTCRTPAGQCEIHSSRASTSAPGWAWARWASRSRSPGRGSWEVAMRSAHPGMGQLHQNMTPPGLVAPRIVGGPAAGDSLSHRPAPPLKTLIGCAGLTHSRSPKRLGPPSSRTAKNGSGGLPKVGWRHLSHEVQGSTRYVTMEAPPASASRSASRTW